MKALDWIRRLWRGNEETMHTPIEPETPEPTTPEPAPEPAPDPEPDE